MINRLQFRRNGIGSGYTVADGVFETREAAIEYIYNNIKFADEGLASKDPSYGFSLLGEPTVLRYVNEEDEKDPHVILAIGAIDNTSGRYSDNKFCIIDIDKTESEIAELGDALEKAIRSLTLVALSSDTLNLVAEKTDDGTIVSGDVKVPDSHRFEGERIFKDNKILTFEDGIFVYVDMEYDEDEDTFVFTVNDSEKKFKVDNNYLVAGYYSPREESLHLKMKHGDDIVINLEHLIAEWMVEGEAANSPIVLKREEVGYGSETHAHVEPWQDILSADVRIATERVNNILKKTDDNRYLYVDGVASNIVYYKNGVKSDVETALNDLSTLRLSTDSNNILTTKTDGFFASSKLEYITSENTLVFTTSSNDPDERKKETRIRLNSFNLFENIYYDSATESLVVSYIDGKGDLKYVSIPIGEMLQDWEWDVNNYGHSVFLKKERKVQGADQLSADVNIFEGNDNILTEVNHHLYVKGTADNIKYENTNVKNELDKLERETSTLGTNLNAVSATLDTTVEGLANEVVRAMNEEARIEAKIDSEVIRATNLEAALDNKINIETDRAISTENEIKDIIGDGFGVRNTVRDEIDAVKATVDEVSANTETRLKEIVNVDHSIDVNNEDAVRPQIKVNLSTEIEDGKENIIKLNNDGLYVGVDLEYTFNEEVGSNQLIFKTTNGTKTFDIKTNSVIDKIYYDASREAIIVEYTVNGQRMPDVVIPVGDLINEWRVDDGHDGAIKLEKDRVGSGSTEQDVLKAAVVISESHEDNILVNDGGALYVSGKAIEDNRRDIDALTERMSTAEGDIDSLESGLAEEASRLDVAYAELKKSIDDEVERSTAADEAFADKDEELEGKINLEITRSMDRDNELTTQLTAETTRAMSAETSLGNSISNLNAAIATEVARSTESDALLNSKIDSEIARSTEKDTEIVTNLTAETTRATSAETALRSSIETTNTALANEITRSTEKDNALEAAINAETARSTEKDVELDAAIVEEKNRATLVETYLENSIGSEATARETEDARIETKLDGEIARSTEKDAAIEQSLSNAVDSLTSMIEGERLTAETTPSIALAIEDKKISANAKISAKSQNIIKIVSDTADGEGLYATVDLSYDAATNTLQLKTNDITKEIALSTGSIIDSIDYDPVGKNLVIKYTIKSGGQTIQQTVTLPVEDLFNDWTVQEGQHLGAVVLTKTEGEEGQPDILSAEVVVSTLEDNILINDQGSLYVSGQGIANNRADIDSLNERMNTAEGDIDTLESGLAETNANLNNAYGELNRAIESEVTRATSAESTLGEKIDAEITRSTEKDAALESAISNEVTRSTEKDNAIETALTAETTRATSAETALRNSIENTSNSLNSEITRSTEKDNALEAAIGSEVTRSTEKDIELSNAINAEENRAKIVEAYLENTINSEVTRATNVEENLSNALTSEVNRAIGKENDLNDKIDEKVAELNAKIDDKSLSVKDTVTVDMDVDDDNKISSNVNVSVKNSNIIKVVSDTADGTGLFASVDLDYDAATNKLTLKTSSIEKEIALSVGSILKSITYDDATRSLVVKYDTMSGGQAIEQTITVPVADLFNDWIVQEGQHLGAIILNKTEGEGGQPDVLSAEVVISTLQDNMLVNDQGALYVSNRPIAEISGQVESIREDMEEALGVEDTDTLHLERIAANNHLKGDVKLSSAEANLITVDRANGGLMFDGNIECGTY